MELLWEANRLFHIVVGFTGLAAWWIPVLTKKGGKRHKLFGKVFAVSAYIVGTTAVVGASTRLGHAFLVDGIAFAENVENVGFILFLGYLGVVTIGLTHFAVRTVRTRKAPETVISPVLLAISVAAAVGSVVVFVYALAFWTSLSIILLALSPIGLLFSRDVHRYARNPSRQKMAWWYEHMGAMLGAGIAFHTAFLVFGSRVFFDLTILGSFNWVPWVLPALIGTAGGSYWERFYKRKFGDLPARAEGVGAEA